MSALWREAGLLWRSRAAALALLLLALLSAAAVGLGLATVAGERAAVTRVLALSAAEEKAVQAFASDAGYAAYYTFHPTWQPASDLAFAALGSRDVMPAVLRVRALALEGQIHEREAGNPELALPGRFDLAFVAVYLAPLLLIALLHDLWSGEREAGRLPVLAATPGARARLWAPRIAVRAGGVLLALLLPFAVGAVLEGTPMLRALGFGGLIALVCLFWTGLAVLVAWRGQGSATNAAVLAALWFLVTLVAPAALNLAINAAVPLPDGAAIVRENREEVHAGWDRPKTATMDRFVALYPAYADRARVETPFHWKWYFAFQQLGDEHVAADAGAWRAGVARRAGLAGAAGWLLPPLGVSHAMHRLAGTDVAAQLAYQDRIRRYHRRLREFYYGYLFDDRPFGPDDFARAPRFDPAAD